MSTKAEVLLGSAIAFREGEARKFPLPSSFQTPKDAIQEMASVLIHEGMEAMKEPLEGRPENTYLHPVDIETEEPGIVEGEEDGKDKILRRDHSSVPLPFYSGRKTKATRAHPKKGGEELIDTYEGVEEKVSTTLQAAKKAADKEASRARKRAEGKAGSAERKEEAKREREKEGSGEKRERLRKEKEKREERKKKRMEKEGVEGENGVEKGEREVEKKKEERAKKKLVEPICEGDESQRSIFPPLLKKRRKGEEKYFSHPLPHHRHLTALLTRSNPSDAVLPALTKGESVPGVEIISGPPGTGKTRELVERMKIVSEEKRILACAPTNVGVANLYMRCVQEGMGEVASLCIPKDRVPPGTVWMSNDPKRRVVCTTVSSRSGPVLDKEEFENVFLDEAGQCMEAWAWTLMRGEVTYFLMAGDVKQLPSLSSKSGEALLHNRSLMERLLINHSYENHTLLTVQNRMAPSLLSFPNEAYYSGELTTGEWAPKEGRVEFHILPAGKEEGDGTSFRNRDEAFLIPSLLPLDEDTVIISPYASQCRLILSLKTGIEVHTVDSFQGREADTVVLSLVRDGSKGIGFWEDERRSVVALTRAKRRLIVIASNVEEGWSNYKECKMAGWLRKECTS